MRLFHATPKKNIPKILAKGLIPKRPTVRVGFLKPGYKPKGVYLTADMFRWVYWVTNGKPYLAVKIEQGAIIEVDVLRYWLEPEEHEDHYDGISSDTKGDYVCKVAIPPERIKRIWTEVGVNQYVPMPMKSWHLIGK